MRRRSASSAYPLAGLILGLGAPIGAFLLRYAAFASVRHSPADDFRDHLFFYAYQLIGTCIIFATAGVVAGQRAERLARAEEFYHRLSEHDSLTGLLNARAFRERYQRSIEHAARRGEPLSLMLIDVDHLKTINDQHGHSAGNEALLRVTRAVSAAKRADDTAARWGGDEFAILLDGADRESARRVVDKLLASLREQPALIGGHEMNVSVTIGVCTALSVKPSDDLFARADRALYEGKSRGRNRAEYC